MTEKADTVLIKVTLRRVHITIIAVENLTVLHIPSVCF